MSIATQPTRYTTHGLPISQTQAQLLLLLKEFLKKRGYFPTVDEFAEFVSGSFRKKTATTHLLLLEQLGYIKRSGVRRGLITVEGVAILEMLDTLNSLATEYEQAQERFLLALDNE